MNKKYLYIAIFLGFSYPYISTKSLFNKVADSAKKAKHTVQKAGNVAIKTGKAAITSYQNVIGGIAQNSKNILFGERKPVFCPVRSSVTYAPTVEDANVKEKDAEKMIPLIKKYSPIVYLCNERYYPIAAEDYFTAPDTQLVYQPNHKKNPNAPKTVVIPPGKVTMEGIYNNRREKDDADYFFEIGECTKFGSNPAQFTDKNGNLSTPVYVNWSRHNGKIYIVYVFLYGYNGAYPINVPLVDVPVLKGDIAEFQGAHECDLEHITLELNTNGTLERIYFAAHGSPEGVWLPANSNIISYEGTHPIAHAAINGHGSYPRAGTHVRIYGFGNDITCKGKKWVPQLVLMYPNTDERFNVKTMGWAYHTGNYGPRGVGSYVRFFDASKDLTRGMPLDKVQFCPNPKSKRNPAQWLKYRGCIESKRFKASVPKKHLSKKN